MGFQDDWIMRQIDMLVHFVAKVVFNRDTETEYVITSDVNNGEELTETDLLHLKLCTLIKEGKICEAEDMLYDNMVYSNDYIKLATDFYSRLNRLSDEELEIADFSRDEVYEDYVDIMGRLGVPVDVFGQADRSDYE